MDSKVIGAIISSLVASLVGSFFTAMKIASDNKLKIDNINRQVDDLKNQMISIKLDMDQKVLMNQAEFISRKEFEMFLKVIENIDKNVSRLNDKFDELNSK